MFTSKEYRAIARDKLRGKWGMSILVTFLAGLLDGLGGSGGTGGAGGTATTEEVQQTFEQLAEDPMAMTIVISVLVTALVISLAAFIIGSAVELGHNKYYIDLVLRNEKGSAGVVFSRFGIFGKALGLRLYIFGKVFLWSLLLVIPGTIAAYRYWLAPYLMAEHPEMGIRESVEKSKELMQGHKWRLFCLNFSFIGWSLLSALTFGIGNLWLNPYIYAADAAFYIDRTGRSIPLAGGPAPRENPS